MSSEWVDVCFLSGAAGCRGSLRSAQGYSLGGWYNGLYAYQYTMSASSPRSSVPAATVKPSGDMSQERSAFCSPSNGTTGCHRSGFKLLDHRCPRRGTQISLTLDRGGTRAVIPYAHDSVSPGGENRSSVCAGNRVNTTQRCCASLVSFKRAQCLKRSLIE